jgi:carbonic anhydrase
VTRGRGSRRQFLARTALALAALGAGGPRSARAAPASPGRRARHPSADDVLKRLLAGNARFAKGETRNPRRRPEDYRAVAEGQEPIAVILGCADSRVPPELLFDVGVGDLFVVRVAGNVVGGAGPVVKGSAEYAVAELDVPLIMVLGHSGCGAVKAAIAHLDQKDAPPGAINDLVALIGPAVAVARRQPGNLLDHAIRANVMLGMERLEHLAPILAPRVREGRLKVAGGVYDLRSGAVALVDREPRP